VKLTMNDDSRPLGINDSLVKALSGMAFRSSPYPTAGGVARGLSNDSRARQRGFTRRHFG
jgi:hypothetical protein